MNWKLRVAVVGTFVVVAATAAGQAAGAAQAPQAVYAPKGERTCLECHNMPPVSLILQTPHAVKADARSPFGQHQCESCHGASPGHIDVSSTPASVVYKGPLTSPAAQRNRMCLACHESAGTRMHWAGSAHEVRGVACNDCHNIHATDQKVLSKATQADVCYRCHKEQRAQARRVSTHPLAATGLASTAKMSCSDCHNPHGSVGPTLLVKSSVNETCYSCHAEKRGPFLWEHAPVTDNCANCHSPHGSSNAPLLKTRPPFLCQECHSGDHGAQINSGANLAGGNVTTANGALQPGAAAPRAQMGARACLNCHVLVHGSNHPAGAKFQR
ncbi:MAG: DmsE family decaheme c-type cytochrome [Acidobacteriota bacterium]